MKLGAAELEARVRAVLGVLLELGGFDGSHHKAYAIDQAIRVLTGCPTVVREAKDVNGKSYSYDALGESEEYKKLVANYRAGEDGPETYDWDVGIPP